MYPEWALKFKTKGTILRKKDNISYYLFQAHSERIKEKKYPVLVQDELLGIITENGIEYNNRRIVDINNIINISFESLFLFNKLDNDEKNIFNHVYLLKIKNKYFFQKLTYAQTKILEKYNF